MMRGNLLQRTLACLKLWDSCAVFVASGFNLTPGTHNSKYGLDIELVEAPHDGKEKNKNIYQPAHGCEE